MTTMEETKQTPHIVILPTPGIGHLIPLAEFTKQLVLHHNFIVTFTIPTDGSPSKAQKAVLNALPKTIDYIFLPPVDVEDLPENVKIETRISITAARSLSSFREVFKALSATTRLVALVVDLFGTDAFDIAKEFNVSPYIFFPATAMVLSLIFHLPMLDEMYSCEYRDLTEPVKLPGCIPFHGRDFWDPAQDKKNEAYRWLLHHAQRYKLAEGVLVNSFMDLESGAIEALKEGGELSIPIPPVYPVGPLIRGGSKDGADELECLRWLDDQPSESVLFVSFGSGGTLTPEQLIELALGLELSEQRFLWVVKSPTQVSVNASFFSHQSIKDPFDFLPDGFIERTEGLGLVVPSWAPQIEVLSHGSTGGFMTHCGWNSILESVVHGVPLIAWPLFAEQKMNAVMLVEDLKVALRPKEEEIGIVGRGEIATVVKGLLEGEEGKRVRNRMRDLKNASAKVMSEYGSSTNSLSEVANKWKTHNKVMGV